MKKFIEFLDTKPCTSAVIVAGLAVAFIFGILALSGILQ